jgi:DNA-directed RNA polymerase specialized sigma24 family protein
VDTGTARHPRPAAARQAVTDLYQAHAVGLIRLAVVMLGDRPTAEDVVQEAFCGLYRRWDRLADQAKASSRAARTWRLRPRTRRTDGRRLHPAARAAPPRHLPLAGLVTTLRLHLLTFRICSG